MKNRIAIVLLATVLTSSCVGVFIAGAATGGLIVYDRRSIKTTAEDSSIRHQVARKIAEDASLEDTHITVSSFNHTVLLAGQTPLASQRVTAGKIARTVPNIRKIYNEIEISSPSSAMTRSSDAWITTKVKTKMLATSDLKSGQIKVVTENGTVFLMGIVTREQANLAVDVARRVDGVQKIVKVFSYKA